METWLGNNQLRRARGLREAGQTGRLRCQDMARAPRLPRRPSGEGDAYAVLARHLAEYLRASTSMLL